MIIAKHGALRWEAEHEDSGPYYIASRWMIFASFGCRLRNAGEPGSTDQARAFKQSQRAWYMLKTEVDPSEYRAAVLKPIVQECAMRARKEAQP
jgi:hypothetical protein